MSSSDQALNGVTFPQEIERIISRYPVFLLIKGEEEKPHCKFSKQMVELMIRNGIQYKSFNVLNVKQDPLYEEFKKYSKFPTFPQLFLNGEFKGGLDVCRELLESGELREEIKQKAPSSINIHPCYDEENMKLHEEAFKLNVRLENAEIIQLILNKSDEVKKIYETLFKEMRNRKLEIKKICLLKLLPGKTQSITSEYIQKTCEEANLCPDMDDPSQTSCLIVFKEKSLENTSSESTPLEEKKDQDINSKALSLKHVSMFQRILSSFRPSTFLLSLVVVGTVSLLTWSRIKRNK